MGASEPPGRVSRYLQELRVAYDTMRMPTRQYLRRAVVPSVVVFLVAVGVALVVISSVATSVLVIIGGLFVVFVAVVYPQLLRDRRENEIRENLHLFITHMTVLSATNIDRVEVFRTLAGEQEYGELAEEMKRIVKLVDTWNQSLDEACRRRAEEIPDEEFADVLERLAYTVNAGQSLNEFLLSEQDALIEEYVTHYESSLDDLDVLKNIYLSMVIAVTFALVFVIVLPMLSGTDPHRSILGVLALFIIMQFIAVVVIRIFTPKDPLWELDTEVEKPFHRRMRRWMLIGGGGAVLVSGGILANYAGVPVVGAIIAPVLTTVPKPFHIGIAVAPLIGPGVLMRREAVRIRERDQQFPDLIRSLGTSESVQQTTTEKVLEEIRTRDFGPLTRSVKGLYRRLSMRIDIQRSWDHFVAESRSYLVEKFSDMYVKGRRMGGDPQLLGELISSNMNKVLQLRERRRQTVLTFVGLIYGVTAAAAFSFFVGVGIVNVLSGLSQSVDVPQQQVQSLLTPGVYDLPFIQNVLLITLLLNAGISAVLIREIDDGHLGDTLLHFVGLTWTGAAVAWVTQVLVDMAL